MRIQDEMRLWIRSKLHEQGRGARKQLADFLGLTPNKVTRMLNVEKDKETRAIKADEWLKIEQFFSPEGALKKIDKPVIVEKERLSRIYDSLSSERQNMLMDFAVFLASHTKKR